MDYIAAAMKLQGRARSVLLGDAGAKRSSDEPEPEPKRSSPEPEAYQFGRYREGYPLRLSTQRMSSKHPGDCARPPLIHSPVGAVIDVDSPTTLHLTWERTLERMTSTPLAHRDEAGWIEEGNGEISWQLGELAEDVQLKCLLERGCTALLVWGPTTKSISDALDWFEQRKARFAAAGVVFGVTIHCSLGPFARRNAKFQNWLRLAKMMPAGVRALNALEE